jgi:hypothetical protein
MSSTTTGAIRRWLSPHRVATLISVGTVATVAAYNSYWHQVTVATLGHQSTALAHTLPLSVDGMLAAATLAMAEDKVNGLRPRGWARAAFWLGAAVSVAANVASVITEIGPNPLGIGVSAWAPIALLFTVEIMARPGKPNKNVVRSAAARKGHATRRANGARSPKAAPVKRRTASRQVRPLHVVPDVERQAIDA